MISIEYTNPYEQPAFLVEQSLMSLKRKPECHMRNILHENKTSYIALCSVDYLIESSRVNYRDVAHEGITN